MFERYTEKARRVLFAAQAEAGAFGSPAIETEHLLLGLAREDLEIFHRLVAPGITVEMFREPIVADTPASLPVPTHIGLPLSNESKRVLAYANEEAQHLGDRHIRTGHLLLALAREKGGWAADLLRRAGADLARMRVRMATEPRTAEPGGEVRGGEVRVATQPVTARPSGTQLSAPADAVAAADRSISERDPAGVQARALVQPAAQVSVAGEKPDGLERCSERAKRAIFFARHQASQFGTGTIEPAHLLLGMWKEGVWIIHELLGRTTPLPDLRQPLRAHLGPASIATGADIPLSDPSRRVIDFACDECDCLGGGRVGIGHLLLGILLDKENFAAQVLRQNDADIQGIRKRLMEWGL